MGIKKGQMCHYQCGRVASTGDHIVARCHLQKSNQIPMKVHQLNIVPCCTICNFYKSYYRSDCNCETCMLAWELMAEFILPKTKKDIPLRPIIGVLINLTEFEGEGTG